MSTVTWFVDVRLAREYRMLPGELPPEMLDSARPPEGDWRGWKPIPSTVTAASLAAFESELGIVLPPPYRELLCHVHFLELHAPRIRFGSHPPKWQRAKKRQQAMELLDEDGETLGSPAKLGLFVLGDDANDGGPICLDLRHAGADGDCRVVFVDHETGARLPLFSSTSRMFDCFAMAADAGVDFFDDRRDKEVPLAKKRELMLAFLALDPEGAGGPARAHWSHSLAWALKETI